MNLCQTVNDDVKDFVDDEVDRTRDSERDLRRAGRRWYDDHDNEPRGRSRRGTDDDLEELRDAVRALSRRVAALAKQPSARTPEQPPITGYDGLTAEEIVERLSSLSQSDLAAVAAYEETHDARVTVLDRVQAFQAQEPWSGYDEQTVPDIRAKLGSADEDTAKRVRDYERRHKNRQGVLDAAQSVLT